MSIFLIYSLNNSFFSIATRKYKKLALWFEICLFLSNYLPRRRHLVFRNFDILFCIYTFFFLSIQDGNIILRTFNISHFLPGKILVDTAFRRPTGSFMTGIRNVVAPILIPIYPRFSLVFLKTRSQLVVRSRTRVVGAGGKRQDMRKKNEGKERKEF